MKKFLMAFLAFMVFVSSSLLIPTKKVSAVGADTAIKIVAGSQAKGLVRAIGEKIGTKFSKDSLDATTKYINGKAANGDAKAIEFVNKVNAATGTPSETKTGWKKYVLDPFMWLTGADLILEGYQAFKNGLDGGTKVQNIGTDWSLTVTRNGSTSLLAKLSNGTQKSEEYITSYNEIGDTYQIRNLVWESSIMGYVFDEYTIKSDGTQRAMNGAITVYSQWGDVLNIGGYTPKSSDLVDISVVNNDIQNIVSSDDDTTINNITTNIEVEIPETDDGVYDPPKNPPLTETEINIIIEDSQPDPPPPPPPVDTDGDGVTDDTDSTPNEPNDPTDDGTNLFENLIPIVLLIGLFDLLSSVLMYLVRMFTFIVSIPLIPAKPIDNAAFEWFRTAEIIGIQIYTVISSLGAIGLSFAVYKAIRRLLS